MKQSPELSPEDEWQIALASAKYCLLPSIKVVTMLPDAMFPTARSGTEQSGRRPRGEFAGNILYDDNTTPRWSIFWSHGIMRSSSIDDWRVAHVFTRASDANAYTRIANLLLVPKSLACLTDNGGPLAPYLRYHAQSIYSWPADADVPKPERYDEIAAHWQYLDTPEDPRECFNRMCAKSDDKRMRTLRKHFPRRFCQAQPQY